MSFAQREIDVHDVRAQWQENYDRIRVALWPRDRDLTTLREYERMAGKVRRLTDAQTKSDIRDSALWHEFTNWRALTPPDGKAARERGDRSARRRAARRAAGPQGPSVVEAELHAIEQEILGEWAPADD